jgi:hypothetical protein
MPQPSMADPFADLERAADADPKVVKLRKRADGGDPPPEEPPADPEWKDAPFECLGVSGETWWFRDGYSQISGVNAGRLAQRGPLNVLLAGDARGWASAHFPEFDKEGNPTGDYSPRKLHKAIAAQMQRVGLFDPTMPRRGPGVWVHAGKPVVHCGDAVLFADGPRSPSFIRDGVAYVGARAIPLPEDGAGGRAPPPAPDLVDEVERRFLRWNWDQPNSERMLLGWWTIANLGALAPMRPLAMVDGQEGGGKSTLLECVAALCPAGELTNDTTEAGLRQRMNQRAAPMVLDEFEGEELVRVLALLRRIVTGEGSRSFRGQGSQQAIVTEVVGTAIMGAIGAPVANAAETTRMLRLMLWPRAPHVAALDRAEMVGWCRDNAAALWGRAIACWPRIQQNAAVMRGVLDRAGCSPRYMDMLGWLVGAREAMVSDVPLDDARAEEALGWAWPWVVTEAEQSEDTTAARCLQHLMAFPVQLAPAHNETVAVLIARALREPDSPAARSLLEIGLRMDGLPIQKGVVGRGLYIASGRRPGLSRLFHGTEWQGGRWGTVLAQLRTRIDDKEFRAAVVRSRVRFTGENDRAQAVWLAPELLPGHGQDAGEGDEVSR